MTREQLIEVIAQEARRATSASGKAAPEWDALHVSLRNWWLGIGENILDALTAAGMVVLPREPTEAMLKSGAVAFYGDKHDVLGGRLPSVYSAMTEAANG